MRLSKGDQGSAGGQRAALGLPLLIPDPSPLVPGPGARLSRVLLALILAAPGLGLSKSDDAEQPVRVEADTAELNERTGVGIYRGNVRITQGSMTLTADEVTFIAPGRDLRRVIAHGKGDMATFRQLTDAGDELTAEARSMEYEPDKNLITLLGNAVLRNAANRFGAERIVYHIDRQVVDAGDPNGKGRVEMTLVPEDDGGPAPQAR